MIAHKQKKSVKYLLVYFTQSSAFTPLSWILCLIGMCWQLYYISRLYAQYLTSTQVTIFRPEMINPPDIDVCFKKGDIQDFWGFDDRKDKDAPSPEEYFNATASSDDFISSGEMRSLEHFSVEPWKWSFKEMKNIRVKKYLKQRYICYSIGF